MSSFTIVASVAVLLGLMNGAAGQTWPQTRAERTNYAETSHYGDVIAYLHDLQRAGAPISVQMIGKSPSGKEIPLVAASFPPVASAAEAQRLGRPIVYVQANIHAGEVEGKEAILTILRRLSQDGPRGLLGKIVLLTTPIYNIDGNEAFGPVARNRPEQDGPGMVGVRANGQGLDLNRDAIKAESPEMRAVLANLYNTWDPDVMIDLHTTDGTRHGWELTYAPPMNPNTDEGVMHFTRDVLLPTVRRELRERFAMLTFDYGNVQGRRDGKGRAWYTYAEEGRYCTHYVGLRGRISVLSEATTFIPFQARVVGTDRFISAILAYVAAHGRQVMDLTRAADARVVGWGLNPATAPPLGVRFDFASRGTEEVLLEHPLPPGSPRPFGRPKQLDKVKMEIFDRFKVTRAARFPAAYLLTNASLEAIALLLRHGIVVEKIVEPWHGSAEVFHIEKLSLGGTFQGHRMTGLEGTFDEVTVTADPGAYLVRTAQPLGRLVFHMLEPESLDGIASWGFLGSNLSVGKAYPILKLYEPPVIATETLVRE